MDNKRITTSDVGSCSDKDFIDCTVNNKLNGLYYYYLEEELFFQPGKQEVAYNTSILGTSDAICNVTYTPFLNLTAKNLTCIPYDTGRFGGITGRTEPPKVYRINRKDAPDKMELISKQLYNIHKPQGLKTKRDPIFESKLYDFPYRTIIFYSNVFDKYEVIPHLMDADNLGEDVVKLDCYCPVSAQGNFYLNVEGYKDKSNKKGILERYFVNSSFDIPNTSSAYSNFMATQKASTSVNLNAKLFSAGMTPIRNAVNGGTLIGAGIGALMGTMEGAYNYDLAIKENMAMKQDLITTPNSLKSAGGDIMARLSDNKQTVVYVGEMTITEEYKQMLGSYFAMYGYKQNKLMSIKEMLRSRYYYNYIKTIGCNVRGVGVPKNYINQIKSIFDNGVTLWHMDREGVTLGSYQYENIEMSLLPKEV